MRWMEINY